MSRFGNPANFRFWRTSDLRVPLVRVLRFVQGAEPRFSTDSPGFVLRLKQARLIQTPKRDFHLVAIKRDDP